MTELIRCEERILSVGGLPNDILSFGNHLGFWWIVRHNGMGFRCGYARIPRGHPWHGLSYFDIDASVHGGLTFSEPAWDGSWWIGFDCAHAGDKPDPDLEGYIGHRFAVMFSMPGAVIRSQEYVEDECRSLCEQAAESSIKLIGHVEG